jgi:hypothetical protein
MARSRTPFTVAISGVLRRACACRSDSQLPTRMPVDFTLFTRTIPAANSGASSLLFDFYSQEILLAFAILNFFRTHY